VFRLPSQNESLAAMGVAGHLLWIQPGSQVSQKLGNFQAVPTLNLRDDAAPKPEQLALECATTITRARDPQFK